MIELYVPEFTKVPAANWDFLCAMIRQEYEIKPIRRSRSIHRPDVLIHPALGFTIVKPRLAVLVTKEKVQWYHVCRPVKLAQAIENHKIDPEDPWYDLNWLFGHFNDCADVRFYSTREWKCWKSGCHYRLTKAEILMVKAAILKIRT